MEAEDVGNGQGLGRMHGGLGVTRKSHVDGLAVIFLIAAAEDRGEFTRCITRGEEVLRFPGGTTRCMEVEWER